MKGHIFPYAVMLVFWAQCRTPGLTFPFTVNSLFIEVEPRYNKPHIMKGQVQRNHTLHPSQIVKCVEKNPKPPKNPHHLQTNSAGPLPWHFVLSGFHCTICTLNPRS